MHQETVTGFMVAKRSVDVLVALLALIVLSPALLLIALWVKLDSPGPAFYKSTRLGKGGRPFTLYKFRTMHQNSQPIRAVDGTYLILDDDPRMTRAGRILRIGFDELPQLVNVLWGQMSLIGPRADPVDAVQYYGRLDQKRLAVKPGISGLAQVNGRTQIALSERRTYDLAYVAHPSPLLDNCIFFLTMFELLPFLARWGHRVRQGLSRTTQRLVFDST